MYPLTDRLYLKNSDLFRSKISYIDILGYEEAVFNQLDSEQKEFYLALNILGQESTIFEARQAFAQVVSPFAGLQTPDISTSYNPYYACLRYIDNCKEDAISFANESHVSTQTHQAFMGIKNAMKSKGLDIEAIVKNYKPTNNATAEQDTLQLA